MKTSIRLRLSAMMFLQFFIWGAWFVTMGTYLARLGFQGTDIGDAYTTTGWAAILSPLFVGMVADRFFAAQRVLGVMHLAGAAVLYWVSQVHEPAAFFWLLLLYALCYMPTVALSNAVAFEQMESPGKEFPAIRVLGTIGWIAAGWLVGLMELEASAVPLQIAAGASLLLGLYAFFLPQTPPKLAGQQVALDDVLGFKALGLLRDRSFAIFALSSLLLTIPLAFYYNFTNLFLNEGGMENAAGKMTFGQMSEIVFMLLMPLFFARLGVRKMLLIGMVAWIVRYILFALGNTGDLVSMLYLGILLHGVCYDFFFVTGQIYVDTKAPPEIRANAQGLITLITLGIGTLIGGKFSGWIVEYYTLEGGGHLWSQIWYVPALMATVVVILFGILFKENSQLTN